MTQHTPNVIVHPNGALIGKCGACDVASFGASRITPCDTHKREEGSHAQPEKNPNDHDRPHRFDVPGGMVGECLFWGCSERNPEEKITPAMHRAAPTMLEALLDITRWVDPDLDPLAGVILTKARAAIAAAEGRTDLTSGA